jgi:hypothetical protein
MQTKIEIPEGYEIDQTNSTFELIKFKKIESKYPTKIKDIRDRHYYIMSSMVRKSEDGHYVENMFTEKDCEEHLAFIQVDMLCQAWNKIDEFENKCGVDRVCIYNLDNKLDTITYTDTNKALSFKDHKTAELFLSTFRELLETCKRLL